MSSEPQSRKNARVASLGHNAQLVFNRDYDRFLLTMTAPPELRDGLFALFAFNFEISKVLDTVSEPMLGEIRFEWWREAIEECVSGTPRRHATVSAIAPYLKERVIDRTLLDRMIDARAQDMARAFAREAPLDFDALAQYARDTGGLLARAAGQLIIQSEAVQSDAGKCGTLLDGIEKAGTAFALIGLMRALPFHQQAHRRYIPDTMLESAGVSKAQYTDGRRREALAAAVKDVTQRAFGLLEAAKRSGSTSDLNVLTLSTVRRAVFPTAGHAVLARIYAKQLRSVSFNPFDPRMARPPLARGLRLLWARAINAAP